MAMTKTRLFSSVIALFLVLFLFAKPSLADPLYDQCMVENQYGNNLDLGDCAREYMDRLDRQLNGIPQEHFYLFLKECEWRFNNSDPKVQFFLLKQLLRASL